MLKRLAMILALAAPAAAAGQYEAPINPPDQAAQLAEMAALYEAVCLRAFPDDTMAARAVARYRATPLSTAEVRNFLHDDPGIGWRIEGRTGRFHLTIEQAPPYHSCAVRTMTAAGFSDMSRYRSVIAGYESGRSYETISPVDRVVGELRIVGGGDRRADPDGSSESLLFAITTPAGEARARGMTAVEIRFAHQYYRQAAARTPSS